MSYMKLADLIYNIIIFISKLKIKIFLFFVLIVLNCINLKFTVQSKVVTKDVTELQFRFRKIRASKRFSTFDSDFGSDKFEAEVIIGGQNFFSCFLFLKFVFFISIFIFKTQYYFFN